MISYTTPAGDDMWDIRGLTTDIKPVVGVPNGSTYYEIDGQHRVYMFDAAAKKWIEQ